MKKLSIFIILILLVSSGLWAADTTYGPKVYKDSGGDREVVASGGKILFEDGGVLEGLQVSIASTIYTAADWVLSAAEAICSFINLSSGSGTANIIAPDLSGRAYIVRNSGNSTITIKKSGGTGVAIATGKTAMVIHNGSDYVRVTADATN
jgi:hypothetical protein